MPTARQNEAIAQILGTVAGTVLTDNVGTVVIFLRDDPYVIRVSDDGATESAYLVTAAPADIAEAMGADEAEIGGWSTGWDC